MNPAFLFTNTIEDTAPPSIMAPSISLFGRRKPSQVKSPDWPSPSMSGPASSAEFMRQKHAPPRLMTRGFPIDSAEDLRHALSDSSSNSPGRNRSASRAASPAVRRQNVHQPWYPQHSLPTPDTPNTPMPVMTPTSGALSAVDAARRRALQLPMSPPESPAQYSPMSPPGAVAAASPPLSAISAPSSVQSPGVHSPFPVVPSSPRQEYRQPPRFHRNIPSAGSPVGATTSSMRELELKNRELEAEAAQHLGRINALRQSHAAMLNSLREEQALDAEEAKRQEAELMDVIAGKEKELEEVRTVRDSAVIELEGLRLRVRELEGSKEFGGIEPRELERKVAEEVGLRRELEDKVEGLKRMADQARRVARREFERAIATEREQSAQAVKQVKEEMEEVVQEEEKRRAELSWLCREKLEKLELLQRMERREFDAELEKIRSEKEEVEKKLEKMPQGVEDRWNSVITHRTGHEELVAMVQKIAGHLAEEKKKNKRLENSMAKVTEDAWYNVSDSKHEIQKLRNDVEDKNTQVATLKSDHAVLRKERTGFQQAWGTAEAENAALMKEAENRKLRIEDLEIALDSAQRQLDELRVQSDVHDDLLAKLSETSSGTDDTKQVADLKQDIKLYRSDIRAYRRDLKKKDQLIAVLQNKADISGSHTPPDAGSGELKRKMEQQQLVLNELDEQMEKLKKEKDDVEENARKQLKKMQQNMLKLNVAGRGVRYRASPLPPLPAGEAEGPQAVVQKKAVLGGEGEKKWGPETPPKDQPKSGSQTGDTFEW